jgi:type IV pilus assembly protein PilB
MWIGQILVRCGLITDEIRRLALERQRTETGTTPRRLGAILAEDFGVDPEQVNRQLAKHYGFSEFAANAESIDEPRIETIRQLLDSWGPMLKDQMIERTLIPYGNDDQYANAMVFLAAEPTNAGVTEILVQLGLHQYELLYYPALQVRKLYDRVLPQENEYLKHFREATESEVQLLGESTGEDLDVNLLEDEIHQSMLTDLVEGFLIEAVKRGASDIHVLPRGPERTEIYFRIDGRLRLWHAQEGIRPESVAAVIKDRARNVDRFEWDAAQDGFIQRRIDGHLIRYRMSVLPLVSSEYKRRFESIVIRVLDDRKVIADLRRIGFQEQALADFTAAISRPQGIVILTGPTGSGKSTTLVAALNHVISPEVNVLTVEDPVEYNIRGARQLKINPRMGFELALRSILRHDPDIVMVGEIRDRETADLAIKLANTGHLTFTTLHTNDAPSAISRLYKMGVEPFLIAYAINIVVAQRLLRSLCPLCKAPDQPSDDMIRRVGFADAEIQQVRFFRPAGCAQCQGGYRGRVAIHEALLFTRKIRQLILRASQEIDEDAIRSEAIRNGMLTLRSSGRERVRQELVTVEEVALSTVED